MNIILKRLLAQMCIISMLVMLCGVGAYASEQQTTLTVATVNAQSGTDVDVAIDLSGNNIGILAMKISITYDSNLTLKKAVAGDALSSLDFNTSNSLTTIPFNIAWDGADADFTNGTVAILTFTVPENAEGSYDISVSYEEGDIFDNDFNDINVAVVNGEINVASLVTEAMMSVKNVVKGDVSSFSLDLVSPDNIGGKILVATYYDGGQIFNVADIYDAVSSSDITVNTKGMEFVKIMWWEDMSSMKPVCKSTEIDLTE